MPKTIFHLDDPPVPLSGTDYVPVWVGGTPNGRTYRVQISDLGVRIRTFGTMDVTGTLTVSGPGTAFTVSHDATVGGSLSVASLLTAGKVVLTNPGTALQVNNDGTVGGTLYATAAIVAGNTPASLDTTGKLRSDQIPPSLLGAVHPRGGYNAVTNTPSIASSGVGGVAGDIFTVTTAGTVAADAIGVVAVADQISNTGTSWIKIATSSAFGTMAAQNANAVTVTGGSATGLSTVGITSGATLVAADPRMPDLSWGITDGSGNIAGGVDVDGNLLWKSIISDTASFNTLAAANFSPVVLSIGSNAWSTPDEPRFDGLSYAIADAAGNVAVGVGYDGVLHVLSGDFVTLSATSLTIASLTATSLLASNLTVGGNVTQAPADPRFDGLAWGVADANGLVSVGVDFQGTFRAASGAFTALTAGSLSIATLTATNVDPVNLTVGSNVITSPADPRSEGFAHAIVDASGNITFGIDYAGTLHALAASFTSAKVLSVPSAATDATNKDYVDGAVAAVGSGLLEPHLNFGAVGDGVTDDSTAMNNCIAAAIAAGSRFMAVERTYYVPTMTRTAGQVIMVGEGSLKGAPVRKYVIPSRASSPPPPTRNLVARAHCPNFTAACRAGSAKVVLTGDSVSTAGQSGFSFMAAFNAKLHEKIMLDNPGVAINWVNRGIGGQTWGKLDSIPTAFDLWYSNHATPWLDYIEAELPDLVIISFSRNDGAALLVSSIASVLAKIAAWSHPCDVVVTTSVGESQSVDLTGGTVNAITIRNGYEYASGLVRSYAMAKGIGLIDTGRRESLVRFGYDPENIPLMIDPAVTGGAVSSIVYDLPLPFTWPSSVYGYGIKGWVPPGKWSDLGGEISFEIGNPSLAGNRGCKFWIKRDASTKQISYRITTTRTADGGNADNTFIPYTDVTGWVVPDTDNTLFNWQLQGSRIYFGPSGGVEATADEIIAVVAFNGFVPRMGGMWQPVIRCASGTVSGALKAFLFDTSAVVLSAIPAKPCLYMPSIIDQEFGAATYSENLWGGGVPHPSSVACELILQPVIDAADFSTAS